MALRWDVTMFFVCLQVSESVLQAAAVIAYLFLLLLLLILERDFLLRKSNASVVCSRNLTFSERMALVIGSSD